MPRGGSLLMQASSALSTRAMFRAAAGDFDAARADLLRIRRLILLASPAAISIDTLTAEAASIRASQAAAALAAVPTLTDKQLQLLRADLANPALQMPHQFSTSLAEHYVDLDSVMMLIRGDYRVIAPALILQPGNPFDAGDLAVTDWNIVLRDANLFIKQYDAIGTLPTYAARKAALDAREPALVKLQVPGPFLFDTSDRPYSADALQQYLKLRPNESRDDYSHRIATVLFDDPLSAQQVNRLAEREKIYLRLAQLTVDLADYHRTHHAWPDSLAALGSPVDTTDPFSGKPLLYHTENDTFTLYSVGINEKDDHGKEDDFTISNAPPPPPATAPAPTDPPPPN